MAVWSAKGAIIVRWNRGPQPVITSPTLGSVLPPLSSATGRVLFAHLPRSVTADAVRLEQRARPKRNLAPLIAREVDDLIRKVRRRGAAWVDGGVVPGLRAFAAPVIDYQGEAAAAITLVSAVDRIATPRHPAAKALVEHCAEVSRQAGTFELSAPRHTA